MPHSRFWFPVFLSVVGGFFLLKGQPARGDERAVRWAERRFTALDKDGDGRLTTAELPDAQWQQRLDLNGDGSITREEAREVFSKWQGAKPSPETPAPQVTVESRPQQGPRTLPPAEYGVGEWVPDLTVRDVEGKQQPLSAWQGGQPLVLALINPTCPVSKRYLPTLAALQKEYAGRGVRVLPVALGTEPAAEVRAALAAAGLGSECLWDEAPHALARALHATAATDCVVLDRARTLIYRGAVDDQYGLGYSQEAPRRRYLVEALEAHLAGQVPAVTATEAPGCVLELGAALTVETDCTYHNRISRLLQSHCVECHRTGGVAPFPLETYAQVTAKAGMVRRMVEQRLMPPWFAAPVEPPQHSPWMNDRSLTEVERSTLLSWLKAGKPEGDAAHAPLPRTWPTEWQIGQPDLTVQIPRPLPVQATGTMPYQHIRVPTGLTEEKWVRGFEVMPTAREVVHHVLIFVLRPGDRKLDREDNFLAAYVPGNNSVVYPAGMAKRLPAGSELLFQIHYTPNGTATRDQVKVGLLFASAAPAHEIKVGQVVNHRINIPPGVENHLETALLRVPAHVRVLGFMPHMHMRGKAFRYEAVWPDGTTRTLLEVPRYDFNWQLSYRLTEPLALPAGAQLRASAWFDNSTNNPANPDATATVKWGQQTTDEMMLGYVEYYLEG